jgi:hypothetical protein
MPFIASLKIAALAIAFICIGIGAPQSDRSATIALASESPPTRLHCRIYFGCAPLSRTAADSLTTHWSESDVFDR